MAVTDSSPMPADQCYRQRKRGLIVLRCKTCVLAGQKARKERKALSSDPARPARVAAIIHRVKVAAMMTFDDALRNTGDQHFKTRGRWDQFSNHPHS